MNKLGVHYEGHNIIVGAVEVINRRLTGRNFHVYIKPDRLVDPEAFEVHGISDEFYKINLFLQKLRMSSLNLFEVQSLLFIMLPLISVYGL